MASSGWARCQDQQSSVHLHVNLLNCKNVWIQLFIVYACTNGELPATEIILKGAVFTSIYH